MDLRQLRYFVQIVESGSLAKASRQLFIAQPALSQQVAKLEDEVGRPLFIRSSRGVVPTENGAALYQHAKFVLRQLEETIAVARQDLTDLAGRVTIGMGPTTVAQLALPFMEHLAERLPRVRLNVIEGSTGQLEYMTRGGQLDLAVLFTSNAASDLIVEPLMDEELFVMLPANSTRVAADRDSLTLREVAQLPLFLSSLRHNFRRRRIEIEFERAGLPLDPVAEVDSLSVLLRWVEQRDGVTIQPSASAFAIGGDPSRWRCLSIADAHVVRTNYLYTLPPRKLSPSAAAVRDELHTLLRKLVGQGQWRGVTLAAREDIPTRASEPRAA